MQSVVAVHGQSGTEFRRKLIGWGAGITLAHYLAVVWHVTLLVKVQPGFPTQGILALLLVNLVPVAAFAKGFHRSAAVMAMVPLGVALCIGGFTHFLSSGTDSVLRMPSCELTLPFQISAALLVVLEALGCWIAVRMYGAR